MPQRPRRRQIDRSLETRALLIGAAIELLRRDGFAGASTAAIAKRAGVTTGALHHHFATKCDLFLGVLDQCNERVRTRLERIGPPRAGGSVDVTSLVSYLWEVYGDPEYWAIWEIIIGTRADEAFHREVVGHRLETMRHILHPWMRGLGLSHAREADLASLFEFMLIAIRGLSLERFLDKDKLYFKRNLNLLANIVETRLAALTRDAETGQKTMGTQGAAGS
jgi:AcrR family transcriptional regulator